MNMKDNLKEKLILNDKKRIKIKNEYKSNMISSISQETDENYVFFPKSLISADNYQLRYGLSWLENGFILKLR